MKNLYLLILIASISLTSNAQNDIDSTITNWTTKANFEDYVGARVYLPPFADGRDKSKNWFNNPFLFSKEFKKTEISSKADFKKILQDQAKHSTADFNFLITNIYKPDIYSPLSSYSKKLRNAEEVSDKVYKIIDIVSKDEVKGLMDDWNDFIETNNRESKELLEKKRKWDKSDKSMVYYNRYFDAREGFLLLSEETGDTIYFIDFYRYKIWEPKDLFVNEFIYIPYIKQQKERYEGKQLVYDGDWSENENKRIISKETETNPKFMDTPNSKWVCEIVSFKVSPYTNQYSVAYQLQNTYGNTIVVFDLDDFIEEKTFNQQEKLRIKEETLAKKQETERKKQERDEYLKEEKEKLDKRLKEFIQKYGQELGTLVAKNELKIGMTKEMCSDAVGFPTEIKHLENEDGKYDVWRYSDILTLYFINDKLKSIKREI